MGPGVVKMTCFCVYLLFLVQIPSQAYLFDDKTTAVPQSGNVISDKNYFALVDMILKEKQLREQYMVQIKDKILAAESKTSVLEHKVDSITPNNGTVSMEEYIRLENSFTSLQREFASLTQKYSDLKRESMNNLNKTRLQFDSMENKIKQLNNLEAVEGRQDIQNVKKNITLLDNGVKVLARKIDNLDMKQQARAQDFLALYNTTINLQSVTTALTTGTQSMRANFSTALLELRTDQNNLEKSIHEMNATLKKDMVIQSKQVAVTACTNYATVKASTPMLFQSIITSYGVTQTLSLVTSGIFKCEDPGLYIVILTAMSNTYDPFFHIYKNSQYLVDAFLADQPGGHWFSGSASVVVQLNVNDQITVKPAKDSLMYGPSTRQSTCITLIKVK